MPKLVQALPKYSHHKSSGRAYVRIHGKFIYLAPALFCVAYNGPMSEGRKPHVEVSLTGIRDKPSLHQHLQDAFNFPEGYGRNWDAFRDAISGLVTMPRRITFKHWGELEKALPKDAALLRECLADLNREHPASGCEVEYS